MATTTYNVFAATTEGEELVATKSKKQVAVDLAQSIRSGEKRATRVETNKGTVVFEAKARKPQKKTKPYTRVVALPEGFVVPDVERVAYLRSRKACAITHEWDEQLYRVRDLAGGEVLATFSTTRQCGRFLADHVTLDENGNAVLVNV